MSFLNPPSFLRIRYEKKLADLGGSAAGRAFLKAHEGLFGLADVQCGLEVTRTNRSDIDVLHSGPTIPVRNSGDLVAQLVERLVPLVVTTTRPLLCPQN